MGKMGEEGGFLCPHPHYISTSDLFLLFVLASPPQGLIDQRIGHSLNAYGQRLGYLHLKSVTWTPLSFLILGGVANHQKSEKWAKKEAEYDPFSQCKQLASAE